HSSQLPISSVYPPAASGGAYAPSPYNTALVPPQLFSAHSHTSGSPPIPHTTTIVDPNLPEDVQQAMQAAYDSVEWANGDNVPAEILMPTVKKLGRDSWEDLDAHSRTVIVLLDGKVTLNAIPSSTAKTTCPAISGLARRRLKVLPINKAIMSTHLNTIPLIKWLLLLAHEGMMQVYIHNILEYILLRDVVRSRFSSDGGADRLMRFGESIPSLMENEYLAMPFLPSLSFKFNSRVSILVSFEMNMSILRYTFWCPEMDNDNHLQNRDWALPSQSGVDPILEGIRTAFKNAQLVE
ncbi:9105_t:CDS:2, partial [Acaulospora colombiana]